MAKPKHAPEAYNPRLHGRQFPCAVCDTPELAEFVSKCIEKSAQGGGPQWPVRRLNTFVNESFDLNVSDTAFKRHLNQHEPKWDSKANGKKTRA